MYLRPKTTRRLLIIGFVLAVVFGIAGTVWVVNTRKSAARIAKAREDAMAAFAKKDFAEALPHFSVYLSGSKTAEKGPAEADTAALLAYGKSRMAVPLPKGQHLLESIYIIERYLQLKPGDREAQHLLLGLYPQIQYNEEAVNLANVVIKEDANDLVAMRAKYHSLTNRRQTAEALATAEEVAKKAPTDIDAQAYVQELTISLAKTSGGDVAAAGRGLVERYTALLSKHPDDPRFEMLLGRAYIFTNDLENGRRWLKSAAGRTNMEPETARVLVALLEQMNLFDDSRAVLERLAGAASDDPLHVRPLVKRLWQADRANDVLRRTDGLDPTSPTSDTELLAYRVLALYDLNRPGDAAPIVDALAARKDDIVAGAWAVALRTRESDTLPPKQRVTQYRKALDQLPGNEVFNYFLGEAYASLGETEPARAAWREASREAPSWSAPTSAIARLMAATGRTSQALGAAEEAYRRSPKALGTNTGWAVAAYMYEQQNPSAEDRAKLLAHVERIQTQFPGEPETLPIYASLLSRASQRDKAIETIKAALNPTSPPSRETLMSLTSASYVERLGLEGEVLDFAERTHGIHPQISLRRAVLLSQSGKPREGLKLLETARQQDTKSDPIHWSLVTLRYRESIDDDSVLTDWVRLGDANPDNTLVQNAILSSPSRTRDKAFWLRTIDRLKKLTGDEAVVPRIERARWLLSGETTEKDASAAIVQLSELTRTDLPEVHRLLGLAMEKNAAHKTDPQRTELLRTASSELMKAFLADNADASIALDLTRVYRAMGRNDEADRLMAGIAGRAATMGVDGKKRTAQTLISQGQLQKAIEVLEPVGDGQDVGRDAMLCRLYRRTGANDKAMALYRKLLADQRVEADVVAEGADFFATQGKADEADKFLAKLKSMDVAPSTRDMMLARYAELHGTPEEALKGYQAAVTADPTHPAVWETLVGYHLRQRQLPEAIAAADRGLAALPGEPTLQTLRARAAALQSYNQGPNVDAIAGELANDPDSGAVTEMVRIVADARQSNQDPKVTIVALRKLADANPDLTRLQMYVAQEYAKLGQNNEAEAVAVRAASRAPNDADAARLLMLVYLGRQDAQKWPKVLDAARQWRQRSLDNPLQADLRIAHTLIQMRRHAEAVDQLKSYAAAGFKPETANPSVVQLYVEGLIGSNRQTEAAKTLTPLAKADAKWRAIWIGLGATAFTDGAQAVNWLDQVATMIPADATAEQTRIADAWVTVGSRLSSPAALDKAKTIVEPLIASPQANADAWFLYARWAEAVGNYPEVIRSYRKLLESDATNPDLQNNLAYGLLESDDAKNLAEARQLAETATAKSPANSVYLDTLARIHLKSGDLPAAEQAFQKALDAERTSVDAMIGLADVHAKAGRADKAREMLARINDALKTGPGLSAALQRQLDGVRQSVSSGAAPSGRLD